LVGGKDVVGLGREVWSRIAGRNVLDLSGKLSLRRTMAVIAGAERFIGHESGLLHVAVAMGVPVVGIFGPGNKVKWGPHGPSDEVLALELDCSPCTRFGYTLPVCRGECPCIRKISFSIK
jgi:ADP-heptose:LPS heptosyltransferase